YSHADPCTDLITRRFRFEDLLPKHEHSTITNKWDNKIIRSMADQSKSLGYPEIIRRRQIHAAPVETLEYASKVFVLKAKGGRWHARKRGLRRDPVLDLAGCEGIGPAGRRCVPPFGQRVRFPVQSHRSTHMARVRKR